MMNKYLHNYHYCFFYINIGLPVIFLKFFYISTVHKSLMYSLMSFYIWIYPCSHQAIKPERAGAMNS